MKNRLIFSERYFTCFGQDFQVTHKIVVRNIVKIQFDQFQKLRGCLSECRPEFIKQFIPGMNFILYVLHKPVQNNFPLV